ncbi:MAG: hypothetical protein MUC68_11565, partial [Burkholderiaceae bacterium]|nr:hypothetical protein [Burkholderiaceae bacterium]
MAARVVAARAADDAIVPIGSLQFVAPGQRRISRRTDPHGGGCKAPLLTSSVRADRGSPHRARRRPLTLANMPQQRRNLTTVRCLVVRFCRV